MRIIRALLIVALTPFALFVGVAGCVNLVTQRAPAAPRPLDCPDDGRLKGVKIGSPHFRETVAALPGGQCLTRGPNGTFLVTPDDVRKVGNP